jgi:serine/threonine protein kinase
MFDLVKGVNLKKFLKNVDSPLKNLEELKRRKILLDLFKQIVEQIGVIHRSSLIHSDIKPDNVMIECIG